MTTFSLYSKNTEMFPVIDSFKSDFGFLSNFHFVRGLGVPTTEHGYQAAKADYLLNPKLAKKYRKAIHAAEKPGETKRITRLKEYKIDSEAWDAAKVKVMKKWLKAKFALPDMRQKLLDTYPRKLVEGNNWGDVFWGVCNGKGKNMLGKLLMKLRLKLVIERHERKLTKEMEAERKKALKLEKSRYEVKHGRKGSPYKMTKKQLIEDTIKNMRLIGCTSIPMKKLDQLLLLMGHDYQEGMDKPDFVKSK